LIEEGIAVYVEPIARIQAKQMNAEQMWADFTAQQLRSMAVTFATAAPKQLSLS